MTMMLSSGYEMAVTGTGPDEKNEEVSNRRAA
jgi:hypothetical protein